MSFNLDHGRRDMIVYSLVIVTIVAAMAGIASIGFASAQTDSTTGAASGTGTAVATSTTASNGTNSTAAHTCTNMGRRLLFHHRAVGPDMTREKVRASC